MTHQSILVAMRVFATAVAGATLLNCALAQTHRVARDTPPAAVEQVPAFDKAYLSNVDNIKLGEKVWTNQCRHCHGNSAYPGKAPKLNPGTIDAELIFDRVTNGFRKMPAWKEVFSLEERKGVVAYVKSDNFSP